VRVPSGEPELARAAAAGDRAAGAALWDAYGARVFAFCQRVLGRSDAAADATQDAFLLAHAQLGRPQRAGESFGVAVFAAARTTSYELLARDGRAPDGRRRGGSGLSAAAARLRPQQRAALALTGLEGLRYAEIAAVLGIGADGVGALLARARLRLHDELRGTALAAAAVRSPDCEDVLALLAAASDGELGTTDAGWADPHVTRCPTCPRTRRAMDEAAATYAAWSPAVPPSWLRTATLAELAAETPAGTAGPVASDGARAAGARTTPRPGLSAALLGATLLAVAFAALLLGTTGSLRQSDPATSGARLPDAARSVRLAAIPAPPAARPAGRGRAARGARRARKTRRPRRVAFVPVRAVRRVTSAPQPAGTRRPAGGAARRPKRTPTRHPAPVAPAPAPAPAAPSPVAPAPASADAPADELPGGAGGSTTAAVPASAAPIAAVATPSKTTTTAPAAAVPVAPPARPAPSTRGNDHDRGGGRHESRKPCPPPPRCRRRSCRH
jgi:DNA-directed RNA polymerase specialized sigma24 family protein